MTNTTTTREPRWPQQHYQRNGNNAPSCWACQHYQRKERDTEAYHWCELSRKDFPHAGAQCGAYLYEPGSDAMEFVQ